MDTPDFSSHPFTFACPLCRTPLTGDTRVKEAGLRCPADGTSYHKVDSIWRFLSPERAAYLQQFIREYSIVRRAEGRGSDDPGYYRVLPFEDRSGKFEQDWQIRAKSYQALVKEVVSPLEKRHERPLVALDMGAGNAWLSYRLAARGHCAAAVDLLTDAYDGLGAYVHYGVEFTPIQAEFDRLPLCRDQADLVIFNASFHYSTAYGATLAETLRVLRPAGRIVIMDSPVYQDGTSGAQMVREREQQFERAYGFPSNALPSESYLTYARLDELAHALGLGWDLVHPFYGWRWALRPWKARLRRQREPAEFLIAVGRREV
jgi:SAM-dependent methyltransferase